MEIMKMSKTDSISKRSKFELSYTQKLMIGFAAIILAGTFFLCLPIATKEGQQTSIVNALLTATSATCVTGLIAYDTFSHWSMFGQIVILLMIQTGGLGFMSMAVVGAMLSGKKIGLKQRELLQEAVNASQVGGIVRLFKLMLQGTLVIELAGAILLSVKFIPMLGVGTGIYYSIFHSISAFCNGGFDLMGRYGQFSSLTTAADDVYFNIVIMLLIILGGLGFVVWEDLLENKFAFRKYKLQTKVVLVTSAILTIVPAVLFFFFEQRHSMAGFSTGESVLASFFQAVTLRTAGFNSIDQARLSDSSTVLCYILMLIGGSPGSTAGGIKTTTAAVLVLSMVSMMRNQKSVTIFNRRLDDDLLRRVMAIIFVYLTIAVAAIMAICMIEEIPVREVAFEVFSAVGTVGITMGVTQSLGTVSRIILVFLMYFGRIGGLSLALSFTKPYTTSPVQSPLEKIAVG